MATIIEMPKLSDTMTEGTLVRWLKKIGDTVSTGDEIAEIETDKATMGMEAFDDGILHAIYVKEGEKVPLGAKMALLLEEGEEVPQEGQPLTKKAVETKPEAAAPSAVPPSSTPKMASGAVTAGDVTSRVKASPLARKIADEKGLDLTKITGSGPGGRIVRADVEGAPASNPSTVSSAPSTVPSAPSIVSSAPAPTPAIRPIFGESDQRIPLTGMRSIIAERLLASKTQIPHFYLTIEVDASPLMAFREQVNASAAKTEGANKYTVNDFILMAVVKSAVAVPAVNASFDGDAIVRFAAVNLSVAIAVEDGLVTPVIRDAEKKSLLELSLAVKDLATRARNKKLSPNEFAGGTLTVSNLGAYGIDAFDAIINPPQAFIIAVSAIRKVPVVGPNDTIVPGLRMNLGMSCDHRVIDGAVAATYLQELRRFVENPALMLL